MRLKFIADMGISQSTVRWLKENHYDAKHLRDENLIRLSDEKIMEKAKLESRVVLTCDLDFGTILALNKTELPSVVLFRLSNEKPANINYHLNLILQNYSEDLLNGSIIIVQENKYRIRKLPI